MKTILASGSAGGLFFAGRGSFGLFLLLLVAKQAGQELAMALFKEALKAGWFKRARRCRATSTQSKPIGRCKR